MTGILQGRPFPLPKSRERSQVFKFRILKQQVFEINGNCTKKKQNRRKTPIVVICCH